MDISSITTHSSSTNRANGGGPPEHIRQMLAERQAEGGSDNFAVSPLGQMVSSLSESEQSEFQNFREQLFEAAKSGDFDSQAMAEQAPDALKSFAEENGIDLAEVLENRVAQMQSRGSVGGRPQQLDSLASSYSQPSDMLSALLDILGNQADDDSVKEEVENITV